jgi:hypothetical protein
MNETTASNHTVTIPILSIIPGIDYDALMKTTWNLGIFTVSVLLGWSSFLVVFFASEISVRFYVRFYELKWVNIIDGKIRHIITSFMDAIDDTILHWKPYHRRHYIVWSIIIVTTMAILTVHWYYPLAWIFIGAAVTLTISSYLYIRYSLMYHGIRQLHQNQGSPEKIDVITMALKVQYGARAITSTSTTSATTIACRRSRSLISRYLISSVPCLSNDIAHIIVDYCWYRSELPIDMINDDVAQRLIFDLWMDTSDVKIIKRDDPPHRSWYISSPLRIGYEMDHSPLIRLPVVFIPPATGAVWDRMADPWNHAQWGHYQIDPRWLCEHQIEQLNNNRIDIWYLATWLATPSTSLWRSMAMLKVAHHGYGGYDGKKPRSCTWKQFWQYGFIGSLWTPAPTDDERTKFLSQPLKIHGFERPPYDIMITVYSPPSPSPPPSSSPSTSPPSKSEQSSSSSSRNEGKIETKVISGEQARTAKLESGGGIPLSLTLRLSIQWISALIGPAVIYNFVAVEPRVPVPLCEKQHSDINHNDSSPSSTLLPPTPLRPIYRRHNRAYGTASSKRRR